MSIIADLIHGAPYDLTKGFDSLEDRAHDACREEAERLNIYNSNVLENLDRYAEHEPDPDEVTDLLGKDDAGDWRAVMHLTAVLTVRNHLEAEVNEDLQALRKAIHEAELAGFVARKLYGTCAAGWMPHDRETDWETGTLYEWTSWGGAWDDAMLRVHLNDNTEAWLDLAWVD